MKRYYVRYKSTTFGTNALFDDYDSHGKAVYWANWLANSFRNAGLPIEANSVTITNG